MLARRIVAAIDGLSLSTIILFDYLIQDGVLPALVSKYVTSGVAALVTVLHLFMYAAGYDLKLAKEQMKIERDSKDHGIAQLEAAKYTPATAPSLTTLNVPAYMHEYIKMDNSVQAPPYSMHPQTDYPQNIVHKNKSIDSIPKKVSNSSKAVLINPSRNGKIVINGN
uniref:Uncharacterized protein n=1 Tax=viral metagenome TaxID=1070528 RepID=A0A2V0RA86_9ZZZZ